jgi:bacillithiol synthase
MQIHRISYENVSQLSKSDRAYATEAPELRPFYKYPPNIAAFEQAIKDRAKTKIDRKTLVEVLLAQYADQPHPNITALLDKKTFTITTAHQPSLFLGPLYFVYKIFSAINLAEELQKNYPKYRFVPVFVIGGEDHDFEEINHIHLFNKKITWQNTEKGAVGSMNTASLAQPLAELKAILGESELATSIFARIEKAYTEHAVYARATQALLDDLFGKYGLVVLNMNDAKLKRIFTPILEKEIVLQPSKPLVEATVKQLNELGYKNQAFPREINLFYMRDGLRERIVAENGSYKVLNTDFSFTEKEILEEVKAYPEYFSPNVVLRPLYQEMVLPNLAYVGGGGELAYWLERKSQFDYFNVSFPVLVRRNSVLWLEEESMKRWKERFELTVAQLFEPTAQLIQQYIAKNTTDTLDFEAEKAAISLVFEKITARSKSIDPTLEKPSLAELNKTLQSVENLESRLQKALKQKHEVAIQQIQTIKHRFFPEDSLQERQQNFLQLYLKHGEAFFDTLKLVLYPLQEQFLTIDN